jgi:hypothetical protein
MSHEIQFCEGDAILTLSALDVQDCCTLSAFTDCGAFPELVGSASIKLNAEHRMSLLLCLCLFELTSIAGDTIEMHLGTKTIKVTKMDQPPQTALKWAAE